MCKKCGCNTCETNSTALMLNESKAPRTILSEGLKHHIDNNKPLTEHLYRAGSSAYFNLIAEARSLYSRGILEFTNEDDLGLLTETDLGHFGMFEGKKVPLDFPIELNEQMDIYDDVANMEFGMDYDQLGSNEKEWVRDEIDNMEMREAYSGFLRNPEDPDSEKFEPTGAVAEFREEIRALFGKFKDDLKNPEFIKGVAQIMNNWKPLLRSQLNENFEMGDRVKLTPDYEETPGEVFTITQISGNRYFIADEDGRGWYTYGQDLVMADDELNESTHPYENKGNIRTFSKDVDPTSLVWHSDKEDRLIEVLEGEGWKLQLDNKLPLLLSKGDRIFINEGDVHRIHKGITDLKIKING